MKKPDFKHPKSFWDKIPSPQSPIKPHPHPFSAMNDSAHTVPRNATATHAKRKERNTRHDMNTCYIPVLQHSNTDMDTSSLIPVLHAAKYPISHP